MSIYEEIEIEDMVFNQEQEVYYYPCPCGDEFNISLEELYDGEDIASCPSCTLRIRVIFDEDALPPLKEDLEQERPVTENTITQTSSQQQHKGKEENEKKEENGNEKEKEMEIGGDFTKEKVIVNKDGQTIFQSVNDNKIGQLSPS